MHLFSRFKRHLTRKGIKGKVDKSPAVGKAIKWIKNHRTPRGGIVPHEKIHVGYQEVTGYSIPTLYNCGEKELARDLVRWEVSVQRADGAFSAPDNVPYTFDTAQVIRGLLSALEDMPEIERNLKRACDYVDKQIAASGEVITETYDLWRLPDGSRQSEYTNLYVLPPMMEAGRKLAEPRYTDAAGRGLNYFKKKPDLVWFKSELGVCSHFFGYMMEALIDLGETELAKKGLEQAASIQKESGAIPAYPGIDWVCSTGMAQLAIAWYKIGETDPANRAMDYLAEIQNPSGGFFGSYGKGAKYFPTEEISWAVKFFIDAFLLMIKMDFDVNVDFFPDSIDDSDGRVQEILSFFGDLEEKTIIDVGCGKGRFLKVLEDKFSQCRLFGLDVCDKLVNLCLTKRATLTVGNMLNIGYPDNFFDFVYSVEALEHAMLPENAVREMVRVLRPGGKIVIIDKNIGKRGVLEIQPWERWFKPAEIANFLRMDGVKAEYRYIGGGDFRCQDKLFVAWEGIKE